MQLLHDLRFLVAPTAQGARLHARRRRNFGARHRGQHRHLHLAGPGAAACSAGQPSRATGATGIHRLRAVSAFRLLVSFLIISINARVWGMSESESYGTAFAMHVCHFMFVA